MAKRSYNELSIEYPNKRQKLSDNNDEIGDLTEFKCFDDIISSGFTDLMKMVMSTRTNYNLHDVIKGYIIDNPIEINKRNRKGFTALMLACANSNSSSTEETVRILLNAEANVNMQCEKGWTALMLASVYSTENTVKMLLQAGANTNITTNEGISALMFVCGNIKITNRINIIKMLLDTGANVNIQTKRFSLTALMFVCMDDNTDDAIEIVKMLLYCGGDVNIRDTDGHRALNLARGFRNKNYIIIKKLLLNKI